ncbi:hypothetical protein [Demequina salsinemoris]|uniref:hypothetical protein n=1 Tax=Demequina salsinemoris TaxID=577470 RepID=UPI000AA0F8CC|nr:hypothetical protein [Demequina salsinemoris]
MVLLLTALSFSAAGRHGVVVRGDVLEMHTIVSCTPIPLGSIRRIHLPPLASGITVECGNANHYFSDRSSVSDEQIAAMREESHRLGAELGVPVLDYGDAVTYVRATRPSRPAGWSFRGFGLVLARREVWSIVLVGLIVTVLTRM